MAEMHSELTMLANVRNTAANSERELIEGWRVLATYRGERHLVGKFSKAGRYWATARIVEFDSATLTGTTDGGGVYVLVGEPGTAEAAELFVELCAVFDERLVETRDVTMEVLARTDRISLRRILEPVPADVWDAVIDTGPC